MEHHKADVWQVAGRGTASDDTTRFLRELRQLRDGAGLGHAELAARAHFPYDTIKAAEAGPTLPDLPVLSAYVRGCGGTAEEWEERWRRLTRTPSLPVSAARHAGDSAAATAGARIGAATQVVDAPDPSVILAALGRVAEGMAVGEPDMDAAPLTIPPRPAYPGDDAPDVSSSAVIPPADVSLPDASLGDLPLPDFSLPDMSLGDVPLPDVSLPGLSLGDVPFGDVSLPDVSPGGVAVPDMSLGDNSVPDIPLGDVWVPEVSLGDAFAAGPADNPVVGSADFSPFTPFTPVTPADDPLVTQADALTDDSAAGPADPETDDRPKGWDPIRVSAAWPAIGSDDPRVSPTANDAPSTDAPSAGWARPGTAVPAGSGTQPVIRQSAWARGADASGEPTGVARPGSRARTLMVAVVLVCVLAVVLAIFA